MTSSPLLQRRAGEEVDVWVPLPLPPALPNADNLPLAARLTSFREQWKAINPESWVLEVVTTGYKIPFKNDPPLISEPHVWDAYPMQSEKGRALGQEVDEMRRKGAIVNVQGEDPGFYSLLFLQLKPGNKWRPIIDLSHLNKFIDIQKFKMESPATVMNTLRAGMWTTSIDLKDAYFHIPMRTESLRYLRFKTSHGLFEFTALPFGLSTAPYVFTRVVKAVAAYARTCGVKILTYIDDWLIYQHNPEILARQTQWVIKLVQTLGFVVNVEKSELTPTQNPIYIGILFNLVTGTASPTAERLEALKSLLPRAREGRRLPAKQWQVLIGHLVSIGKLVWRGRMHVRPFQRQLSTYWQQNRDNPQKLVPLSPEVMDEIYWWMDERNLRRGVKLFHPGPQLTLFTDASLEGWGGHLGEKQCSGVWPPSQQQKHINFLEMKAVQLAMREFVDDLTGKVVVVMTDNTTVLGLVKNEGSTHSPQLSDLAREVLTWTDQHDITVIARHIPGRLNVLADHLSRNRISHTEWSLRAQDVEPLWNLWFRPHVDLFATEKNNLLPTFVAPFQTETCWRVDAFSFNWNNLLGYAFPPVPLVRRTIQQLDEGNCTVILIAPWWPTQTWFQELLDRLVDSPRELPVHAKLLRHALRGDFHQEPGLFRLHAWLVSSNHYQREVIRRKWLRSLPEAGDPEPESCMTTDGTNGWSGVTAGRLVHSTLLFHKSQTF